MKKIGAGLQFDVYDLDKSHVLKKPKKKYNQYLIYLKWAPYLIFVPRKLSRLIANANRDRDYATNYFKKNKFTKKLLGNPKFTKEGVIQNKVDPLGNVFGRSVEEDKKLVDKYVDFVISCWKEGFADRIYNIDNNFGVDKKGNIVLMDFFEISTRKSDVQNQIKIKRWEKSAWYRFRISRRLKKYYKEKMESSLTQKNLNKYWDKK